MKYPCRAIVLTPGMAVIMQERYREYLSMAGRPSYEELEQRVLALEKEREEWIRDRDALVESKGNFSRLFESAPVPMAYATDKDGYKATCWNDEWCRTFGYDPGAVQGKSGADLNLWVDVRERQKMVAMARHQNYVADFETLLRRRDGVELNCALFGRFIEKSGHRLLMVVYLDITERKQAEKDRHRLRNYLSNIINSMPSVMIGVDKTNRVTLWNRTAEKMTGLDKERAQGELLWDVYPGLTRHRELILAGIREGKTKQVPKVQDAGGSRVRYEDVTIYPLGGHGGEGAVIRVDDVSENVRMEEMMMQSEKMLSVGGLAAGMAHEINNPLAGMIQTANVLANRISSGRKIPANLAAAKAAGTSIEAIESYMAARGIFKMIKAIKQSGAQVVDIVDNMLSFARKSRAVASSHNPVELMEAALGLARTDYDLKEQYDFKNIRIKREFQPDLPLLPCESAKIKQVLLNILRNGAQAMQEKIKTHPEYTPEFILRLAEEPEKNRLCIEIQDNGPGMDEGVAKRVFDPFFTTKPEGVGTGLGLSVSYFIITENHEGEMQVASVPGSGANFIIRLPLQGKGFI